MRTQDRPAVLGGTPRFPEMVDIVCPVFPSLESIAERLGAALKTGRLTNNQKHLQEFEAACCDYLGVKNAVAVANGTLSLILLLQAVKATGKAIMPSFTYVATAHAAIWAGLTPVFADIDPDTYNITPETVQAVLEPEVSVIIPVPVFGNPCDVEGFERLSREKSLHTVYDSAHAFGSEVAGLRVGNFGSGESFSLHATKALPTGEGGLITTNDDGLCEWLRAARVFGDYGDHDTRFAGTNAKMSEFPALLGLEALESYDTMLQARRSVANAYTEALADIPGLKFQLRYPGTETTHQSFSVEVSEEVFGLSRDTLSDAMAAENIMTRKYFWPPVHEHQAYRRAAGAAVALPSTESVSSRILCLPMHPAKGPEFAIAIAGTLRRIWEWRAQVRSAARGKQAAEHAAYSGGVI